MAGSKVLKGFYQPYSNSVLDMRFFILKKLANVALLKMGQE
jgi:hypothetical protein